MYIITIKNAMYITCASVKHCYIDFDINKGKNNNTLKVRTILYHNKNYSSKIILRTSQRNQSKQRRVKLKK